MQQPITKCQSLRLLGPSASCVKKASTARVACRSISFVVGTLHILSEWRLLWKRAMNMSRVSRASSFAHSARKITVRTFVTIYLCPSKLISIWRTNSRLYLRYTVAITQRMRRLGCAPFNNSLSALIVWLIHTAIMPMIVKRLSMMLFLSFLWLAL